MDNQGRKTIGLVGFFGWGNFGDELFIETFKHWLGKEFELKVLNDLTSKPYFSRPLEEVMRGIDAIVIGGGDLVMPWTVSELYWKSAYLSVPVFVVGVGVPTWKGASAAAIATQAKFFQHPNVRMVEARDKESAEWIARNLKPTVETMNSADIVFGLPMPKVAPPAKAAKVLGVVTRDRKGEPDRLDHVQRLCEKAIGSGYAVRHIVLGIGEVGRRDLERAADLQVDGKEVAHSESLTDLCVAIGECTVLASMKFHGTVVALHYGVPSLVLSATDKSRNLMRMAERPELLSSLADEHLPDRFSPYMPRIPTTTRRMLRQRAEGTMSRLAQALRAL
ncbi:polysaccharide pyruvyl transferase family protein [Ideonella sp. YS5]|uniref:polysaccharide pyruvyl transferase family protein n=1 Tax=Ideonella sp. YS5 TaxID=3453714 RepID=UPI003EEC2B8C